MEKNGGRGVVGEGSKCQKFQGKTHQGEKETELKQQARKHHHKDQTFAPLTLSLSVYFSC